MKKEVKCLESRDALIRYMRENEIRLKCVFNPRLIKKDGTCSPGIAVRFIGRNAAIFLRGDTKKKAMMLLGISNDSTLDDCKRLNEEIERRK